MFNLSHKSVVINDEELIDTSITNFLTIKGFGTIDKTDPSYSKTITTAVPVTYSTIDLSGLAAGEEVAIFWQNLRYIGEGLSNMSSTPQAPFTLMRLTGQTLAQAWESFEDAFGVSELFKLVGNILTSKNAAINIKSAQKRPINNPTDHAFTGGTGFRFNRFQGVDLGGAIVEGVEGIGNWFQIEESIRTWSNDGTDPYSIQEHGSQVVEKGALYDTYDFTLETAGVGTELPEFVGNVIPDQEVLTQPIHLTIYAKQGSASTKVAGF